MNPRRSAASSLTASRQTLLEVMRFAEDLKSLQSKSGAIPDSTPSVESVTTTVQAVEFLEVLGHTQKDPRIERSLVWLASRDVRLSEYGYWRAVPLSIFNHKDALDAVRQLERLIHFKVKHHENTPIIEVYLDCASRLGLMAEQTAKTFLEQTRLELEAGNFHGINAARLSHQMAILAQHGLLTEQCATRALHRLRELAGGDNGSIYWSAPILSAFVVINLAAVLSIYPRNQAVIDDIEDMVAGVVSYLESAWTRKTLDLTPPAGGTYKKDYYARLVLARALASLVRVYGGDRTLLELVRTIESGRSRRRLRVANISLLGLMTLGIIVGWDWFTVILGSVGVLGISATVLKVLGICLSILGLFKAVKASFPTRYSKTSNRVRAFLRDTTRRGL